jgi:hypothetical protein
MAVVGALKVYTQQYSKPGVLPGSAARWALLQYETWPLGRKMPSGQHYDKNVQRFPTAWLLFDEKEQRPEGVESGERNGDTASDRPVSSGRRPSANNLPESVTTERKKVTLCIILELALFSVPRTAHANLELAMHAAWDVQAHSALPSDDVVTARFQEVLLPDAAPTHVRREGGPSRIIRVYMKRQASSATHILLTALCHLSWEHVASLCLCNNACITRC